MIEQDVPPRHAQCDQPVGVEQRVESEQPLVERGRFRRWQGPGVALAATWACLILGTPSASPRLAVR